MTDTISLLDKYAFQAKNTANFRRRFLTPPNTGAARPESMTPSRPAQSPAMKADPKQCKHPRVRIVTREEDSEFVECLECGEVFESSEFKDMDIEESKLKEM
jgi:hypothetical protein